MATKAPEPKDMTPEELNVASEKDKNRAKEVENLKPEAQKQQDREAENVRETKPQTSAPRGTVRAGYEEDKAELNSLLSEKEGLVKEREKIAEDGEMEENERRGKVAALYEQIVVLDEKITPLLPDDAK